MWKSNGRSVSRWQLAQVVFCTNVCRGSARTSAKRISSSESRITWSRRLFDNVGSASGLRSIPDPLSLRDRLIHSQMDQLSTILSTLDPYIPLEKLSKVNIEYKKDPNIRRKGERPSGRRRRSIRAWQRGRQSPEGSYTVGPGRSVKVPGSGRSLPARFIATIRSSN